MHGFIGPTEKAPPHEINNFWEELQLMKQMTPHCNVINLLGHCTTPGNYDYNHCKISVCTMQLLHVCLHTQVKIYLGGA